MIWACQQINASLQMNHKACFLMGISQSLLNLRAGVFQFLSNTFYLPNVPLAAARLFAIRCKSIVGQL